jgi:hypothetical protein
MSTHAVHAPQLPTGSDAQEPFDEWLLVRIEPFLAMPADTAAWWIAFRRWIDDLDAAFLDYRWRIGGPGGLLDEVRDQDPRLAFQVRVIDRELGEIATEIARLRLLVAASMGVDGGVPMAVGSASALVRVVRAHHRRLRTLLHEAYTVDLGVSG